MLSYEYIQFLNEKIIQYLPQPYVRVSDKINVRCPICGDSKKSATKKRGWVYLNNATYYCFNCGTSLSGIKLLQYLSGSDYDSIKQEYIKQFLKSGLNASLSAEIWQKTNDELSVFNMKSILKPELKQPLTDRAKEYLNNRLVLDAPFLMEPIYSTPSKNNEEYILIPWKVNGVDAFYQINDFLKIHSLKYMFPKNKKKLLYGLDNIDVNYKKIFVFEGVYDSLFVKNGIASGTKSLNEYQLSLIKERWPHHEICVSFDNDKAGFAAMMKMIQQNKPFKFFKWFNKNTHEKDINELVLSKNDVNIFSNKDVLDKMVLDSLQMKLWMISNGKWKKETLNKPMISIVKENKLINMLKGKK